MMTRCVGGVLSLASTGNSGYSLWVVEQVTFDEALPVALDGRDLSAGGGTTRCAEAVLKAHAEAVRSSGAVGVGRLGRTVRPVSTHAGIKHAWCERLVHAIESLAIRLWLPRVTIWVVAVEWLLHAAVVAWHEHG